VINAYRILNGNVQRKRLRERSMIAQIDSIKAQIRKTGYKHVERIEPFQDTVPWRSTVNQIINLRVQQKHEVSSPDD
jgi:hypothetical protein